jgi:hypothetical protein
MSDTATPTTAERAAAFLAGTGGDREWEHELLTALAHQAAPARRVMAEVRGHELTCPECDGTVFGFKEGCVDYRTPSGQAADGDGGTVTVYWAADGTAESGDAEPGLFCDDWRGGGCGVAIDLPDGWEVVYI